MQLETHGCVHSTVTTDTIVPQYQALSTYNTNYIFIVLVPLYTNYHNNSGQN